MFGLLKKKAFADRELELYKKEKKLAIDVEIENYRQERHTIMTNMAKQCHEELGEYEHNFHSTKETRGIELAKLEAKIEALQLSVKAREEVVAADNNLLKTQAEEIKRLNDIITLMINKQAQHTTTIQQLK